MATSRSEADMPAADDGASQEDAEENKPQLCEETGGLAPDGGWGWVVVFGSFLVYFIADGCVYSFGVFYNELLDYFGESKGKTAIIPALLYGFPLLLSPFVCALVNSFGCRRIGMLGGCLVGLGFLISHFGNSVEFLIFSIGGCCSIGLQMSYIAAIMIVTYYFDTKRGFATGLAVAGSGVGTFAFAPIFEALISTYAWRGASLVIAGICFNIMTGASLFRPVVTEPCYSASLAPKGERTRKIENQVPDEKGDGVKDNLIPMVQLQAPEEGGIEPTDGGTIMVLSDSKIVLSSREGSEYEGLSEQSCQSERGSTEVNLSIYSEQCPEWRNQGDMLLLPRVHRTMGKVVSKSAELLNTPGTAAGVRISQSDQRLHRTANTDSRCASLQEIRWHRGASPVIFSSRVSVREYREAPENTDDLNKANEIKSTKSRFMFELKQALASIFDISLMQHMGFLLFCASNFMLCLWFGAPYIYIVDKASLHGIDKLSASFLISIIGISSTVGQVFLGFLGDKVKNCIFIYEVSMVLCGAATVLLPMCTAYWSHCFAVAVFGFFVAANYSLTTLILIQVVGLDKLSTAFGFLQLGQGIGTLLGTPLVGLVYDQTGSYNMAFFIAGAWISLSGLVLIPLHWIVRDESCLHRHPKTTEKRYEKVAQRV